jgi:hypothetical protein
MLLAVECQIALTTRFQGKTLARLDSVCNIINTWYESLSKWINNRILAEHIHILIAILSLSIHYLYE